MRKESAVLYPDFTYPLNVYAHIATREEGGLTYLHYGFFERPDEPIAAAQERSTAMLLERLPPPPARLLDVGAGVGTTLAKLAAAGYRATGITPDATQVAFIRSRFGASLDVRAVEFEQLPYGERFDAVVFQESSQYIDSEALFAKAAAITAHVVVFDEFALQPVAHPGALHSFQNFLAAAARYDFRVTEDLDVSAKAIPTVDYIVTRIPRFREELRNDLGVTDDQVDSLIESGERYRDLYVRGVYGYRVLQFRKGSSLI